MAETFKRQKAHFKEHRSKDEDKGDKKEVTQQMQLKQAEQIKFILKQGLQFKQITQDQYEKVMNG